MDSGFWKNLKSPIMGLSPMDGVTDAPCRFIYAKYGKPSVIMTEFCSIDGLDHDGVKLLRDFEYHDIERPVVAQIYGNDPEIFYRTSILICELGFDGIDVNMGCPAKSVAHRGCGAALIKTPQLAQEIILACKRGVADWIAGKSLADTHFGPKILKRAQEMMPPPSQQRISIPVSVKTRTGFDQVQVNEWISALVETNPAAISLHGRTLRQAYKGEANWDAIAEAARIVEKSDSLFLGNGDIRTIEDLEKKLQIPGLNGVLIGRGAMGNPWIFQKREAQLNERFLAMLEHSKVYESFRGKERFFEMRKHLGWYCKDFRFAKDLRIRLFTCHSYDEVQEAVFAFCKTFYPEIYLDLKRQHEKAA